MLPRKIIPIILSGGSGVRLWPLSRGVRPKQFLSFNGGYSLIQDTMLRCRGDLFDSKPILVGAADHRFMLADAAQNLGIVPDIVLEPIRRDSCAAVVAGCLRALECDPDCLVMIMAADHSIPDKAAFSNAVSNATQACESGLIVTFGVKPDYPATGYGYILPGEATAFPDVSLVDRFVEKPEEATARSYIEGGFLWNSGNFLFSCKDFLAEARLYAGDVVDAVQKSLDKAKRSQDFIALDEGAFAQSPRISIDYAIMEKTAKICVMPVSYVWSDIGTWDSVAASLVADEHGNSITGEALLHDASGVFVHSEGAFTSVVGCKDIVVIATSQSVLVVQKGKSEKVKQVVEELDRRGKGFLA